jgi:hypothetical protein
LQDAAQKEAFLKLAATSRESQFQVNIRNAAARQGIALPAAP